MWSVVLTLFSLSLASEVTPVKQADGSEEYTLSVRSPNFKIVDVSVLFPSQMPGKLISESK